jgi:hypothetical protein
VRYPYAEVELETKGSVHDQAQCDRAINAVVSAGASDVLVPVHGWNNDMPAARRLYERLTHNLGSVQDEVGTRGQTLAVVGVFWPSITWADEGTIAGGGASAETATAALQQDIASRIEDPGASARLAGLVEKLETSPHARQEYLEELRRLLPDDPVADEDPPPSTLTVGDPETAFLLAGQTGGLTGPPRRDGAAGFSISGFVRAARNLLNVTTYYTMKERAGKAGAVGIAEVLARLDRELPDDVRLHLVGHSFGARAVTAAAAATNAPVRSLSLLQGAFSHFGMASDWDDRGADGFFRAVPNRVDGPVLVTHTVNDTAVGLAYAIASRLASQVADSIGDEQDPYGGIGRNGALKTPEAAPQGSLLDVGADYAFAPRHVFNLRADAFVRDHGDVTGPQVAYAIWSAMAP